MHARLFVALWPGAAVRAQLAARRDGWQWPKGATPVRTERLHLTLHFLGDVASARIGALADALQVPFTPFTLQVGRGVLWPHGVAVLEPLAAPPALLALQHALGLQLNACGIAPDARGFKPHVTMARRAQGAVPGPDQPQIDWPVEGYALMQSTVLGYEVVRQYPS